ncbi:MAG: hypothetical protein K6E77_00800 [Lachnospiraceae bacterium]|jgi:hypothetical protein|nr:hypothetical protein [Lachnospiraceae bacterium]
MENDNDNKSKKLITLGVILLIGGVVDYFLPDFIPFVDEILLTVGGGAALTGGIIGSRKK